jgi:hypothetical protein
MNKLLFATLVLSACGGALAQAPSASDRAKAAVARAH